MTICPLGEVIGNTSYQLDKDRKFSIHRMFTESHQAFQELLTYQEPNQLVREYIWGVPLYDLRNEVFPKQTEIVFNFLKVLW